MDYVLRQGAAQLDVLSKSVPIEQALASGDLTEAQRQKLGRIVAARDFARDELGLRVGRSFTLFHDTHGQPLSYNLSASKMDRLEPKRYWFPVIGWIDYIGYFDRADADSAEADLKSQGFDTYLRSVDAFSTLGYFPDPVHSPILERDELSLVETVIHELAHNTVYANGQSDFNESLATWIGRQGAIWYFQRKSPDVPDAETTLKQRYADEAQINDWLADAYQTLNTYYSGDASSDAKIAGREAVFVQIRERFKSQTLPRLALPSRYERWGDLPVNNALILLNRRYNFDLSIFDRLFAKRGEDFAAFLADLKAAADSSDPWAHLRGVADGP
ncbi:MAG: aminopeptidase [Phycisphaerae bacterium]